VAATSGTLGLDGVLSGNGTLSAATGAVLEIEKGGSFGGVLAGAGEVEVVTATTLTAGASLSAANLLATANFVQSAGVSLTNGAGDGFGIDAASGATVVLGGSTSATFTNAGSLSAIGAGNAHVSEVFINTGAASVTAGTLTFVDSTTNNGTITAAGATAVFDTAVGGSGTLDIGAGGTLSLLLGSSAGQTASFLATTGLLDLTAPHDFLGTITGFGGSDIIDLINAPETSWNFSSGVLTVKDGSTIEASLHFSSSYVQPDFIVGSDPHGGTMITFS
jgi:hypothetical protein